MQFGQLIENKMRNDFKNHAQNKVGKLVPDTTFVFSNAFYEVKAINLHLPFNII